MTPTFLGGDQLWLTTGWTMLHFLWLGTVVGIVAAASRLVLRRAAPSVRYVAAVSCFALLAAAPFGIVAWLVAHQPEALEAPAQAAAQVAVPNMPAQSQTSIQEQATGQGLQTAGPELELPTYSVPLVPDSARQPADGPDRIAPAAAMLVSVAATLESWVLYLPWLWIVGTPITFVLLATGLVGAERLRRTGCVVQDGPIAEIRARLVDSLRVSRRVTVAVCERIAAPVLVGILRPVILLPPAALTGWSPDEIEMVLLHELAHVRRWDNLINLAQRLVESLLFFHPAVWWISSWVRREREACCDAVVVGRTNRPHAYAEMLVALAAQMPRSVLFHPAASSAMAARPLGGRIRRILQLEDDPMLISGKTLTLAVGSLVLMATLMVLHLQASGKAEESTTEVDGLATEVTESTEEHNDDKPTDALDEAFYVRKLFKADSKNSMQTRTYRVSPQQREVLSDAFEAFKKDPYGPRVQFESRWSRDSSQVTIVAPRDAQLFLAQGLKLRLAEVEGQDHSAAEPAAEAREMGVADALDQFRRTLVTYDLDFDSVFPKRPWTGHDPQRLQRYPTREAWPNVLGHVDTDVDAFRVVSEKRQDAYETVTGGNAYLVPLTWNIGTQGYATLLFLDGIPAESHVVAHSYTSFACFGAMAGDVVFDSYATALVSGDLSGGITANSYFDLVVTGKFTGRIYADSYAMIYLMGGLDGSMELDRSKVYIAGHTNEADLARIKGTGQVFLEESDLPPGEHQIGRLTVTVPGSAAEPTAQQRKRQFPSLEEQKLADRAWRMLGLELEPIGPNDLQRVKALGFDGGVKVAGYQKGRYGVGEDGIWSGDTLVGLHVWPTTSLKAVADVLNRDDLGSLEPLKYYLVRPGRPNSSGFGAASKVDTVITGRIVVGPAVTGEIRSPKPSEGEWLDVMIPAPPESAAEQSPHPPHGQDVDIRTGAPTAVVRKVPRSSRAEGARFGPNFRGPATSEMPYAVRFEQGASRFLDGDKITVLEVRGTAETFEPGNFYWIKGIYKLGSHDRARLDAYVTAKDAAHGRSLTWKIQTTNVNRGSGTFELFLPMSYRGWPHVSFYPAEGGSGFGGTYFGMGDTVLKKWSEVYGPATMSTLDEDPFAFGGVPPAPSASRPSEITVPELSRESAQAQRELEAAKQQLDLVNQRLRASERQLQDVVRQKATRTQLEELDRQLETAQSQLRSLHQQRAEAISNLAAMQQEIRELIERKAALDQGAKDSAEKSDSPAPEPPPEAP